MSYIKLSVCSNLRDLCVRTTEFMAPDIRQTVSCDQIIIVSDYILLFMPLPTIRSGGLMFLSHLFGCPAVVCSLTHVSRDAVSLYLTNGFQ